jgi:hypothetical protein
MTGIASLKLVAFPGWWCQIPVGDSSHIRLATLRIRSGCYHQQVQSLLVSCGGSWLPMTSHVMLQKFGKLTESLRELRRAKGKTKSPLFRHY